jgi:NAD(P)-dependent dehydrogenase (short-subunit alcohol dehydrogenase family)
LIDIKNKVFVFTGVTGTLGSVQAEGLAKAGAKLALLGRNQNLLSEQVDTLRQYHTEVEAYQVDVLNKAELEATASKIVARFGTIDALINAVGGNLQGATIPDDKTIFDLSENDFDTVLNLNLKGTILPSIVFGKVMSQNGKGAIVNYSSMAVDRAITRVVGYSAAKAAMENFTRWMAVEMALKFGDGLRVNAIAPGFFIAKQNQRLLTNEDGSLTERGQKIINNTPMRRFGKPEELNGAIQFLCSESASFITGAVLPIDGGFNAFSGV